LHKNIWWAFAFLLVALAWLAGLFVDVTGDSGLYSAIVRQMVDSGDWFNLKIHDLPYDQKPHLFFWLAGFGVQLFGNYNFAFKLFPFIYGLAGFYFTYRLGKQVFSELAGKLAALIAGTSQIYFLYFFDFHTDSILQTGVALALWQLAAYLQRQKPANFIFGFLGVGLAMLSKGPIGAVVPFLAVLLYYLAEHNYKQLFHLKWFLGIAIVLVVISPSLIYLYEKFGFAGLKFYFVTNNVGRITGSYAGSSTDYFFYIHTILWAFLPWTIFVLAAMYSTIKDWFLRKGGAKWNLYLLGSTLVLLFILSIAKGKAPNYFLIAVVPISVVTGNWLSNLGSLSPKQQQLIFRLQLIFILLYTLFFVLSVWFFSNQNVLLTGLILLFLFLFTGLLFKRELPQFQKILLGSVIVAGAFNVFLNIKILPELATCQGGKQVLKIYEEKKSPKTQLYNFEVEDYNLFFYSEQKIENIETWEELYEVLAKQGSWIYTNEIKYNDILAMDYAIDTVYQIKQRGLNEMNIRFLNPKTREQALKTNYLIVTKGKNSE